MAKGTNAKLDVIEKLKEVFGDNFIGEVDKKIYVYANDGDEMVQIAIAMTCPKVAVDAAPASKTVSSGARQGVFKPDGTFEDMTGIRGPIPQAGFEISDEESQKVADLMKSLGIE